MRRDRPRWDMRAVSVGLGVMIAGCGGPSPVPSPMITVPVSTATASPEASPSVVHPSPYANLEPDAVLLLRADTQLWTSEEERTVTVPASIVVYADGVAIADVRRNVSDDHEWRAIQLTPQELETLTETLAATRPLHGQLANRGCICHVIVIQARAKDGELVEIAAAGGVTPLSPDAPPHTDAEPWMLALDRTLDHVQFLAEHRKEVETTRTVPQIPAGRYVEG